VSVARDTSASPSAGPPGLWVISFGYLTDGLRGALMALVAIGLPPLLVLVVGGLHRHVEEHPAVPGFVRGLKAWRWSARS
jgi:chromate transporter